MKEFNFRVRLNGNGSDNPREFFEQAHTFAKEVDVECQAMSINPHNKSFWLVCASRQVREKAERLLQKLKQH